MTYSPPATRPTRSPTWRSPSSRGRSVSMDIERTTVYYRRDPVAEEPRSTLEVTVGDDVAVGGGTIMFSQDYGDTEPRPDLICVTRREFEEIAVALGYRLHRDK